MFIFQTSRVSSRSHRIIEHIDEMLEVLRHQPENETEEDGEDKLKHMIYTTDNLEAIAMQFYGAGFRPNIKYGAGKLRWVSLAVNTHTLVIKI